MIWKVIAFLCLTLGTLGRLKYIWQGNKIKRLKTSESVSSKLFIVSYIIYILMLINNLHNKDWIDVFFWGVGSFAVLYGMIMAYLYTTDEVVKKSRRSIRFFVWVKQAFTSKTEGGVWR